MLDSRSQPWPFLAALLVFAAFEAFVPAGLRAQDCGVILLGEDGGGNGSVWPGGNVPYRYAASITPSQVAWFEKALAEIEGVADVRFVPYVAQANFITILPNDGAGCSA